MPPCRGPREQQVGDVRAGDEQHQADNHHQRGQRALVARAEARTAGRSRVEHQRLLQITLLVVLAPVLRHRRLAHLRLRAAQRRLRRLERLIGSQAAHHVQPPVRAPIERALLATDEGLGAERDGDVERAPDVEAEESRRRDADNRERDALDHERSADDVSRSPEAALPERVADHRDGTIGSAPSAVVVFAPGATEDRGDAEHIEVASGRPDAVDELRRSALREVEPRARPGEGAIEELGTIADGFPDRIRPGRSAVGQLAYQDEAVRVLDRQGPQQEAVENREHRRVCPDSEGERQDGHGRHDGRGSHGAEGITNFVHARVRRVTDLIGWPAFAR